MKTEAVQKKRVTVFGGARSGIAVARLLHQAGAHVFVTEYKSENQGLVDLYSETGIPYEKGGHTSKALEADFIVVSPGVPSTIPLLLEAGRQEIPQYSEIEAASWFCRAPVVAITGSNGKTTTTSLTGYIFKQSGRQVHVVGNIGRAFSDVAMLAKPDDVVVLEVSSFQLDHIDTFRPRVSILLNITPDHLDRYNYDFEAYAASKFRIFANQAGGDTLIYNLDDEFVRSSIETDKNLLKKTEAADCLTTLGISLEQETPKGAFLREGHLVTRFNQEEEILMRKEELALQGPHNIYNSLAAAMAARVMEIPSMTVRESLSSFEGVPHRLEFVREVDGVRYINDSKATNVNAVWYALESFPQKIILIAGGRDKGNDYSSLKPLIKRNVRAVIAIGESAGKVDDELGHLADQHMKVSSLEKAVQSAHLLAQPGEVVLLSPACASFDMFSNYEERGDVFKELVMQL